jgi:hypothetical protein
VILSYWSSLYHRSNCEQGLGLISDQTFHWSQSLVASFVPSESGAHVRSVEHEFMTHFEIPRTAKIFNQVEINLLHGQFILLIKLFRYKDN